MMPIPDPRLQTWDLWRSPKTLREKNFHPSLFSLEGFQFLLSRVVSCLFSCIKIFNPFCFPIKHFPKNFLNIPIECFLDIKLIFLGVKLIRDFNLTNFLFNFFKFQ
ncbi:hypothetical protein HanIR_Chr13g0642031 [Helianthus annuus]|nr:hypothetical protein HanIR_Chr13g0642031 [Helianthus annuus]